MVVNRNTLCLTIPPGMLPIPDEAFEWSWEQFRQAAGYIDRILKGAKPAELPEQNLTKYAALPRSVMNSRRLMWSPRPRPRYLPT